MRRSAGRRLPTAPAALLTVALGAGCGNVSGTGDGGGTDAAPPTVAEACGAMSETLCGRLAECAPFLAEILYGDATTCRERALLGCTKDQEVPDTSRTTTDIAACAAAAATSACEDLLADNFPEPCRIKPGARRDGEGCGSSWQCQSTHCEKGTAECGTCAPRQPANGSCTVNGACQHGLVCASARCVTPGTRGASCDANRPCLAHLYCNGGVCADRVGAGGTCASDSNACDLGDGFACNAFATPPTCAAVASARGGGACGLVNGTLTLCVLVNECAGATLTTPGVCAAPAQDGTACSPGHNCLPPATCTGGVCRLPSVASCPR